MEKEPHQIREEYLEYLNTRIKDIKELVDETLLTANGSKLLAQLDYLMHERYKVELALARER